MSEERKKTIFVIGHRNPDTDSICSAIALANLKNILVERDAAVQQISASYAENQPENVIYKAVRAGHLNQETRYVLNTFEVPVPSYMVDARTQIKDIDYSTAQSVGENISLMQAWKIMRNIKKATLAVTDDEQHLKGIITTSDIAKSYMEVFDNSILGETHTTCENILDTLNGRLVAGDRKMKVTSGKVVISAANIEMMRPHIEKGDVVILGNRYEAQLCAIEQDAAMMIVCDGAPVSRTMKKIAEHRNCVIIGTEYDAYTVARLINVSMPIHHFMKEDVVAFNEYSYIDDIKDVMTKEHVRDFPILTDDNCYVGMISRRNLIDIDRKQMILVDHNEQDQAIAGIEQAEVVEIVDHHKLGTIETIKPVIVRNQPVGCTATIVYQMYMENGIEITPVIAGLLCSAIISDTLLFRSPTCTETDRQAAMFLAKTAGIQVEEHAKAMFDAGSDLKSKSLEEIFYQDFKKFKAGDQTFGVGQISSMNEEELENLKEKMKPILESMREKEGTDMIFFLLTDILSENSMVIFSGKDAAELLTQGFGHSCKDEMLLKGVVSRKKQFVPIMMNMLMV